jgi:hypothetical protein
VAVEVVAADMVGTVATEVAVEVAVATEVAVEVAVATEVAVAVAVATEAAVEVAVATTRADTSNPRLPLRSNFNFKS